MMATLCLILLVRCRTCNSKAKQHLKGILYGNYGSHQDRHFECKRTCRLRRCNLGYKPISAYKTDRKASRIKTILTRFKCNCETMMSLLSYELVDEVVNVVVYSENVQFGLYKFLHQITSEDDEEIEWPVPITAAVSSPYLMQFRSLINSNNELCIEISSILPSVSRIFEGVQAMFSTQLRGILELSHHKGLSTNVVTEAIKHGEENIYLLKAHMVACIIGEISH